MSEVNTKHIWTDKKRMSGIPCVRGTRIPVEMILAILAEGEYSLKDIADDYEISLEKLSGAVREVNRIFIDLYEQN